MYGCESRGQDKVLFGTRSKGIKHSGEGAARPPKSNENQSLRAAQSTHPTQNQP